MPLFAVPPVVTPPEPWALGFAAPPRIPFVGDVDADGMADLIVVYPPEAGIIDVNLTRERVKSGGTFQAVNPWGPGCQAAAVGAFDAQAGSDVVGLFNGNRLSLAGSLRDNRFQVSGDWVTLPKSIANPVLATLRGGKEVLAFSRTSGEGFSVETATRTVTEVRLPKGIQWIGDTGDQIAAQWTNGQVRWLEKSTFKALKLIGTTDAAARPAVGKNLLVFGRTVWTPGGTLTLPDDGLPASPSVWGVGDVDGDGDEDTFEFRYGTERHTGNQVLLRRQVSPGETDNDHDGLSNAEEARLGTDPNRVDTDDDGLIDRWEVEGYRNLYLPGLGCNPRRADLVCLVSRFEGVDEAHLHREMDRVTRFYADLRSPNPDGTSGFAFHPIYLPSVTGDDTQQGWRANLAKLRPEAWRGVVHWMQVTPGGGGQASELGDGGTCGANSLWAVFVHEFGHQLGLNHEGFWPNGSCPIYSSLMNYNYSYGFEDDGNRIHYSDGSLAGYVLNENDLDENIPLPYERVKFLEKGPYRFRLKPNGATTQIDWNWNGVFGERHIRADINYAYSTNAGTRDDIGKSRTSPWLFVHEGRAYALFGNSATPLTGDTTLGPTRPGQLLLRELNRPFQWSAARTLETEGLVGDPVATSLGNKVALAYPSQDGVVFRVASLPRAGLPRMGPIQIVSENPEMVPTMGIALGQTYLLLWDPSSQVTTIYPIERDGTLGKPSTLDVHSTNPPGICEDTVRHQVVVAVGQDQDAARPFRWQVRRYDRTVSGRWRNESFEWVEGEAGQARGAGRLTVLFEQSRDTGPEGRLYVYGRGMTTPTAPWQCTYVAHQIADKSIRGGWLVKRYYDEWTQTRSAPAAAWFGNDVIWAYRWVDGAGGPTDNNLHVGYRGLGLQSEPFGDHDDIGFIRRFGMRNCLLSLGAG